MTESILNNLREEPKDLIVVADWFYKIGEPIISDPEYNGLTTQYGSSNKIWDETGIPRELFEKYGIEVDESISMKYINNEYLKSLHDAGTKSISPAYTERDCYNRMMGLVVISDEIVISLKVDGISTRNIIELNDDNEWSLVASLSRSRESKGFDYTDGMRLTVPNKLRFNEDAGDIHDVSGKRVIFSFGEAYVERSKLEYLRQKYGKINTWKTPRSTALSMLRDVVQEEDYRYLKYRCFKLNVGETLSDMLIMAENSGLDIVPFEVIKSKDVPREYSEWLKWFNNMLDKYHNIQIERDIEADGIVVAINNQSDFDNVGVSNDGKYNNATFSCKVGPWGSIEYESKVRNIIFDNEGNTSEFSVVAEIEPVVVATDNTVSRVNCFNPKILVDNNINIGSIIRFKYKSASSVVLVYR